MPRQTSNSNLPDKTLDLEFRSRLGIHIRQLRQALGKGQEEFADNAGIHRNHIGLIERGKLDARISTLVKIATALNVSVSTLLEPPK